MYKNRSKRIAMLLLITLLMTGCWDSVHHVNALNLCTMVILDKQGDEFVFTIEVAKITPAGEGGGAGKKQAYLTGAGKDFPKARDATDMQMDKPLFLGTVRTLILTEQAAAEDLAEYLFRLRENQTYRQKLNIVITRENPKALTEFENEADQPMGFVIDEMIKAAQSPGHTSDVMTEKYVNDILAKRSFITHHIGLAGKQIKLDGYSVFRNAKLVGFIPMEESRGLLYLLADQPIWAYRLKGDGGFVTAEVTLDEKRIKPSYQDGRVSFTVQLGFKARIQYKSDVSLFPLNDQVLKQYSDDLNQVLAQEVKAAIEQSQKQFQSDYLLFGEAFRIAYPDVFENMDWQTEYPNAQIQTSTSTDVSVSDRIDIEAK